jgi:hypothetical protein
MRNSLITSIALHLGLVVVLYFGLPNWFVPSAAVEQHVVVELMMIADETVAALAPAEPDPDSTPQPLPPPSPPPPPPLPDPVPEPEPDPVPEPEPAPAPEAIPEPEPEVAAILPVSNSLPAAARKPRAKPQAPKVVFTPRPRTKPEPPRDAPDFDPTRIAALLDQTPDEEPAREQATEIPAPEAPPVITRTAPTQNRPLTISEIDAFRAQIERCWSVPAGAVNAENLIVTLQIFLNPDGALARSPKIVEQARMSRPGQEYFRAAAESALRAVLKCEPYRMFPIESYELWQEFQLKFDPIAMLGRV